MTRVLSAGACFVAALAALSLISASVGARQKTGSPSVKIPGGVTRLDDIGWYRVTYRYRSGRTGALPMGWIGHFEDATGVSCTPFGTQNGKTAFLLHPPWHEGTGVTDQIFRLALPHARRITLRFAIAMKEGQVGPKLSDGATFRVFLDEKPLLDKNKTDAAWSVYNLDLTSAAGRTVTLRFETDPGPRDNPSFDYALWGDRALIAEGAPAAAPTPLFSQATYPLTPRKATWGGAAPTIPATGPPLPLLSLRRDPKFSGFLSSLRVLVGENSDYARLPAGIGIGAGAYLELAAPDGRIVRSDSPEVKVTREGSGATGRRGTEETLRFEIGGRVIRVRTEVEIGACIRVRVRSEDPWIAAVHFGDLGPVAFRRQVVMPYLGTIAYFPESGLFGNVILDYTRSQASSQEGSIARYAALTNGSRNRVDETAYFALSPDLHSVLPTPPNPPSPYRALLADKVVLDVWGGSYEENADWLRQLSTYGITHLVTIAHVWQNGGYDNKLPSVLPADPSLGGDAGMKQWAQTASGLGELFSLHENYVDFYPNSPVYTEVDVAHDTAGRLVPAWKNRIQSYAVAPDAILKYARMFTPDVHERYGTNASYLDVHSAVPPWFHVDFRKDRPGAGRFRTVWEAHRDLWALFRQVHGGPVLGEGNAHWYWSGLLDGVEAQFGQGVPGNGGQTAPLLVDFDLLKIHPLQFNHGMGYLERWLSAGYEQEQESRIPTMEILDQYRMQEIAYGHAGFVASPLVRSLPFLWQEHNLMSPITARYATANPISIRYEVGGKLVDAGEAAARDAAFDRVQVRYDNGTTVWANGRAANWKVGAKPITLPRYGWLVEGKDFRAYTALRPAPNAPGNTGVVVDYVESPDLLFVNARTTVVLPPARLQVSPAASAFEQTGPRRLRLTFSWDVQEPIPAGNAQFIHVTGAGGAEGEDIVFQTPSGIAALPETWPVGRITRGQSVTITLPEGVADGVYTFRTGLYSPQNGQRLRLTGKDDGNSRIALGNLTVSDGGRTLRFRPTPPPPAEAPEIRAARTAHTNLKGQAVNFGTVETGGSFRMDRLKPGTWMLTPFPRNRVFAIRLNPAALGMSNLHKVEALDVDGKRLGMLPTNVSTVAGTKWIDFPVNAVPGAVRYRLGEN